MMKTLVLFLIVVLLKISFFAAFDLSNLSDSKNQNVNGNNDKSRKRNIDYRLPTAIVPDSYIIRINPSLNPLDNFTFTGVVTIKTHIVESTYKIVLHHGKNLKINQCNILNNKEIPTIKNKLYDEETEKLTIVLDKTLAADSPLDIVISYSGVLSRNTKGPYVSSYHSNRSQQYVAATQFQTTYARQAFPCFDEPQFKTLFSIILQRPKLFKSVSNMPIEYTTNLDATDDSDKFKVTKKMSTYQVAFFISDFQCLVDTATQLKVWAQPERIEYVRYAFDVSLKTQQFFTSLFNGSFQLKLDIIAVPDLLSEATGSWRLITAKESKILYDANHNDIISKQEIAYTITHQLALQWFGNVVSPHWWKDIWLSEGFAQYFRYIGVAAYEPKWKSHMQIVTDQLQKAFVADSFLLSHPISNDVQSPSEIKNMFDTITYMKSASIIRMVEKVFGMKSFFEAVKGYLIDQENKSSTPDDLYKVLQYRADMLGIKLPTSVKTFMDSWIMQAGFPVIHVRINNGKAELLQERFLLNNLNNTSTDNYWYIPITWTKSSDFDFSSTFPKYWLTKPKVIIDVGTVDDWIIFNIQQTGFYRVNYETTLWNRIIKKLNGKKYDDIHEVNRAAIIDDLFNLARARYVDYDVVLSATKYLAQETNYLPWKAAFNNLEYLYRKLSDNAVDISLFEQHITEILLPIYKQFGFTINSDSSHFDNLLQINVIDWACKLNVTSCFLYAIQKFNDWRYDASKLVPVDLRKTIYCTSIKSGHSEHWDFLWDKYLRTNSQYEKEVIVHALGCTMDRNKIHQLLTSAITENSGIRFQDSLSVFSSVYSSGMNFGTGVALDFLTDNFQKIFNYYKNYDTIIDIMKDLSSYLFTEELLFKFQQFIEIHGKNILIISDSLMPYFTKAHDDIKSFKIYRPKIQVWLNARYSNTNYRLPQNIIPIKYNISLIPYLELNNFTFDGDVTMILNVTESTSSIVLHSNKLDILEIKVYLTDSNTFIDVSDYFFDLYHKLNIKLESIIEAGSKLTVSIKYRGNLQTAMEGFYRSYYVDDKNTVHWLATTQFQKYGARQAFPCFDEPALKAKFIINIKRLSHYSSLSNMRLRSSLPIRDSNWVWDIYEESELMSTYLVAFVVSDFEHIKSVNGSFRIWFRPNARKYATKAFGSALSSLKFLENYTGIPYSLKKMDFIAIPDFVNGAMENWGLVTFRERALLADEKLTTTYYKKYMELTIAHELAHMWFGNLVTCEWWEYVWLNEGFGQYFEWFVMDALQPQNRLMEQFTVYELQVAMLKDSFIHMRPMNNKMNDPYDDGEDFSSIAYGKSSSVIRMMQHAFGKETFHESLKLYLKQNQYGTSTPSKLWSAIQAKVSEARGIPGTNKDVATLMDSWASQPGYPVVQVHVVGRTINLGQERFFITGKNASHQELYWIPITIATKTNPDFSNTTTDIWLGSKGVSVDILHPKDEWIILNVQQTGYYRVNYDINIWKSIFKALNQTSFGRIPEINRAQIIDDLLNLARADYISYDVALNGMQYIVKETSHLPWKAFLNGIHFLYERFDGQDIAVGFNKYLIMLISPIYQKVGSQDHANDTQLDKLNRIAILYWACKLEHPDWVTLSKKLFNQYRRSSNKYLSADVKFAVFCTALRYGNYDDWQFLWQQYRASNLESEKTIILEALGCSQNKTAIDKYLRYTFASDGPIRVQNIDLAFSSIYSSGKDGVDASLNFLMKNYSYVYQHYNNWHEVGQLFIKVALRISTSSQLSKLALFAHNKKEELRDIAQQLNHSITVASNNKRWYKTHYPDIETWLINHKVIIHDTDSSNIAVSISVELNTLCFMIMLCIVSIFL